jgi:hypothetical protein
MFHFPLRRVDKSRLKLVATVFIVSRLWTALFVYLGHSSHPFHEFIPGGWAGVNNWWLNPWTTYDSYHFMNVALAGYKPQTANFFPLYPLLLRLAGGNIIVMSAWGVLLSNAAFAVALYYLYCLTRLDCNARLARLAVMVLAFFPTTAYFSAVYSESVFLLLSVAAFYYVRRNRWGLMRRACGINAQFRPVVGGDAGAGIGRSEAAANHDAAAGVVNVHGAVGVVPHCTRCIGCAMGRWITRCARAKIFLAASLLALDACL